MISVSLDFSHCFQFDWLEFICVNLTFLCIIVTYDIQKLESLFKKFKTQIDILLSVI